MSNTTTDLTKLTVNELHAVYLETFGKPTKTRNKPWLIKKITSVGEQVATDEPKQPKKRAAKNPAKPAPVAETEAAKEAEGLNRAVEALGLEIGTVITKTYKGRDLKVTIRADGFELDGTVYKSLSAAAKDIAGCNWNGHVFFGLKKRAVAAAAETRA